MWVRVPPERPVSWYNKTMWSYAQFVAELKSLGFTIPDVPEKPTGRQKDKVRQRYYDSQSEYSYGGICLYSGSYCAEPWDKEPALILSWHTGGIGGGSCWGGENHAYSTGDPEPEWEDLNRILEHFCPNITFIRYKGIMRKSTTDDWSRNEYYGNSTNYAMRILKLKDLWQHMVDNKLFEIEPEGDSE